MLEFEELLEKSRESTASDIHLVCEELPIFRIHGRLKKIGNEKITEEFLEKVVNFVLKKENKSVFVKKKEFDCSFEDCKNKRYRANFHYEKGNVAVTIRVINDEIKTIEELSLPQVLKTMLENKKGLLLITGPCGSGKSTTLAAMIEEMNRNTESNIITLEDPIEYRFSNKNSLIRQREIGTDTKSFAIALKSVLRQDPDIIMVGELRDEESIGAALTAAETGHLVLATLHTNSASETIGRITNVFSAEKQNEIRIKLSTVLKGIVSQILVKTTDGKRVGAYEILLSNPAIVNHIVNGNLNQINTVIESNRKMGMILLKDYLKELHQNRVISEEEYRKNALN